MRGGRLTACQYCQTQDRLYPINSKDTKPQASTEQRQSQICFHHSATSNGTVVIWSVRCFLNQKFFTYMSSLHHVWKMVNKPTIELMQSTQVRYCSQHFDWQSLQWLSADKHCTYNHSVCVWLVLDWKLVVLNQAITETRASIPVWYIVCVSNC